MTIECPSQDMKSLHKNCFSNSHKVSMFFKQHAAFMQQSWNMAASSKPFMLYYSSEVFPVKIK